MHGTYFNATIAVYVTLNLRLGKDEVTSSNLVSSSRKSPKSCDFGGFSYLFGQNGVGQNVGQPPDPHRDPHVEMCGKV